MKGFTLTLAAAILSTTAAVASTSVADFDTNGDGFVTLSEIETVFPEFTKSDFRTVDNNSDNRISAVELQNPDVRAVIGRYEVSGSTFEGLAALDTDGNGFASFDELAVAYPNLSAADYRLIDTNRDNRVSFPELYTLEAQDALARAAAAPEAIVDLATVDANGDGFVGFGELQAAFPGLSVSDFRALDLNGDNRMGATELYTLDTGVVLGRSGS
jgi:Ca2+-binding EF-hand superfamily protein